MITPSAAACSASRPNASTQDLGCPPASVRGAVNGGSRVLNIPYEAGVIASRPPISAITDELGLHLRQGVGSACRRRSRRRSAASRRRRSASVRRRPRPALSSGSRAANRPSPAPAQFDGVEAQALGRAPTSRSCCPAAQVLLLDARSRDRVPHGSIAAILPAGKLEAQDHLQQVGRWRRRAAGTPRPHRVAGNHVADQRQRIQTPVGAQPHHRLVQPLAAPTVPQGRRQRSDLRRDQGDPVVVELLAERAARSPPPGRSRRRSPCHPRRRPGSPGAAPDRRR